MNIRLCGFSLDPGLAGVSSSLYSGSKFLWSFFRLFSHPAVSIFAAEFARWHRQAKLVSQNSHKKYKSWSNYNFSSSENGKYFGILRRRSVEDRALRREVASGPKVPIFQLFKYSLQRTSSSSSSSGDSWKMDTCVIK